jgi:hypothetical protein
MGGDDVSPGILGHLRAVCFPLLAVAALACGMLIWTWNSWADSMVDFGREAYVAWQLHEGARLYEDVAYFNGPLSPHVSAFVFSIFGPSLRSLYLANFSLAVAISLLLFHGIASITSRSCATFCVALFVLLFAFAHYDMAISNYDYLAPYSHEMTHGLLVALVCLAMLGRWVTSRNRAFCAAAGAAAGIVFLTKPEIFAATELACVASLALVALRDRGRFRSLLGPAGLLGIGAAAVIALATACLAWHTSWPEAMKRVIGGWAYVFDSQVLTLQFYRAGAGLDQPAGRIAIIAFWFAIQLLMLRLALRASFPARARTRSLDLCMLVVAGAIMAAVPSAIQPRHFFSPLPVWLSAVFVLGILRIVRERPALELANRIVTGLTLVAFALGMLLKILLNVKIYQYGFVLAMPGTMACVAACWWCAKEIENRGGLSRRFMGWMVLLLALVAGFHLRAMGSALAANSATIRAGGDCPVRATPKQAAVLDEALAAIDRDLGEGQTLAVWPQGCMVNFLTRRKNPAPYIVLMPPEIAMFGEEKILESYRKNPADFVLLLQYDTSEYGLRPFGEGYAQRIAAWLRAEYRPLRAFGHVPFVSQEPGAVLMARKERSSAPIMPFRSPAALP